MYITDNRFALSISSLRIGRNRRAAIITTDHAERRPVDDILWTDETYRAAGLEIVAIYELLATGDEPYSWVNETKIAPWVIYVLKRVR
ncbi:MAG: hypothetical protein WCA81_16095, partial [Rhizomicrobium sp.]